MTDNELDQLQRCPDVATLQTELRRLCSRFGSVTRLTIVPSTHSGKRQVLCLLRMASAEEEAQLMSGLGIGRFGGELVVVVDLLVAGSPITESAWGSLA